MPQPPARFRGIDCGVLMLVRLPVIAFVLGLLLAVTAIAPGARADGKVFRTQTADLTNVPMPDQRAAICFDGTHETLVIESGFTGAPNGDTTGDANPGYAWVVPLPAVAAVSEATLGTFPSLRALFSPRVEQRSYVAAGFLGVLVLCVVLAAVYAGRWRWVLLVVGLYALAILLLPALGKARGAPTSPTAAVSVLSRTNLGSREVTQVTGSADALRDWLTTQGVAISPAVSRVVGDYARDGWVFAAITLAPSPNAAKTELSSPPLIFRFPTKEAIYPMRLTGADAGIPLDVELFVFANGTAAANGFKGLASAPVLMDPRRDLHRWPYFIDRVAKEIEVSHPALVPIVGGTTHATHLRGVLSPSEMARDVRLDVGSPRTFGRVAYTRDAAFNLAIEAAIWALIIAIEVVAVWERAKVERRRLRPRLFLGSCAFAMIAFAACMALMPSVKVASGTDFMARARQDLRYIAATSEMDGLPLDVIRQRVREEAQRLAIDYYDGAFLQEGDRPGEYQLIDDGDSNLDLVWIDPIGRARRDSMLIKIGTRSDPPATHDPVP